MSRQTTKKRRHKPHHAPPTARERTSRAPSPPASRARRALLWVLPVGTLALALVLYVTLDNPPLVGAVLGIGAVAWLALAVASVGRDVPPADTTRAGAIDFGIRR